MAIPNILFAMEMGVTHFDASIGGLGGCPFAPGASGNVCTEDLVHCLAAMGVETGIDLAALIEASRRVQAIVDEYDVDPARLPTILASIDGDEDRYPLPDGAKEEIEKLTNAGQSDWNTEDVFGHSRINFDGWRYVSFPLPGNYPGERYPWPANSQWRWDRDGVVHYPLTLRKLVVELNEKVLHVRTFAPPLRPEIHLRDLTVGQGDTVRRKRVAYEERE